MPGPAAAVGAVGPGRRSAAGSSHAPNASRARITSLLTRVVALDVAGRVGLGVARRLGLGEDRGVVGGRSSVIARQDVVGRAVDDAADALDRGSRRGRGASGPRTGIPPPTAASNRSGAPVRRAIASSSGPWWAMTCLFAVTTRLPVAERGGDQRVGRLVAAHQLDDDVDLVVGDEVGRRVGQQRRPGGRAATARSTSRTATAASSSGAPSGGTQLVAAGRAARGRPRGRRSRRRGRRRAAGAAHDGLGRSGRDIAPNGSGRGSQRAAARERRPLHSRAMTDRARPRRAAAGRAPAARPRIFSGIQPSGHRPPRQRPRRDPQLRPAPVRVRGDLLHRRLPRADEHPRRRRSCGSGRARWRPRCWPSGLDPGALHAVRPEPPARAHRARLAARHGHAGQLARADADLQGEEASSQPDDVNHGLLTYPVLQAADIVIYKASLVPVGKDQAAHLELSREIVRAFNRRYGDTFPEPQAVFTEAPDRPRHGRRPEDEQVGRQHDRHPRRAGASSGSRSCRWSPTRSGSCAPTPAGPRSATSASSTGSSATTTRTIWDGERTARTGCVDTKKLLAGPDHRATTRRPASATRELMADPAEVDEILAAGAERLRPMAEATMAEVREKMGLR